MRKETRNLFIVEGIVLLLVVSIGIGTAFLSTVGKQELANTFTAGCLNITIEEEGRAIDLENRYPVTDIEGLEQDGYTFKIKNNCTNDTNYQINLESLSNPNEETTLKADYVRVSLSSDTMDNLITTLSENEIENYHSENTYISYNLYTGILKGNESKEFTLKEWVEYNTTKENGASKIYRSQINVVSDTRLEVIPKPEIKFTYSDKKYTGKLTEDINNINYCMTTDNKCNANEDIEVSNKEVIIDAEENDNKQMICAKIENKTYCSNPELIEKPKLCPEGATACETILANTNYFPDTTPNLGVTACDNGSNNSSNCTVQDKGLYKAQDDYGETYYFRGSVSDNWVTFAGFYWRIIRINGDGTIRLIYSGKVGDETNFTFTGSNQKNPVSITGGATQINNSGKNATKYKFNTYYNDNKYVGLMYSNPKTSGTSNAYNNAHKNEATSEILDTLYSWYDSNLSSSSNHIDGNAGFCGDRTPYDGSSASSQKNYSSYGFGTVTTYYGSYHRLIAPSGAARIPTFKCIKDSTTSTSLDNNNDLYTLNNSDANNKGNKALTKPIGLITADEVAYAGGTDSVNYGYYLYTGQNYWTMSPYFFNGANASVFVVFSFGYLAGGDVSNTYGVRPVINLKADTKFTFKNPDQPDKGTYSNPYKVE